MHRFLIYMDNCCLNRPFDDLSNDKVRLESEAVYGDYTEERKTKLEDVTIDDIVESIQRRKSNDAV